MSNGEVLLSRDRSGARRRGLRSAAAVALVGLVALPLSACASANAATTATAADDWAAIQQILGGIQGHASAPIGNVTTNKFTPGMLLGNGDVGVIVGGDKNTNQRFYFGKSTFWGTAWNSGHSQLVPAILSLGNLAISSSQTSPNPGPVYSMTQDILNAEVRSRVQLGSANVNMRSYVAGPNGDVITELSTPSGSPSVSLSITLTLPPPDTHTTYPTTVGQSGGTIFATRHNNLKGSSDFQSEVAIAVRPVGVGFSSASTSGNTVTGKFTLAGGSTVELATVFRGDARQGGGGPSASSLAGTATSAVNAMTAAGIASELASHRSFWKNFWLKSYVQTNDATMNAYWYGSLYAMGSASQPGHVLAGMNGQWVSSDFTQFPRYWYNYNVEAPFYGLASANHPDLIQPYNVQQKAEQQWQINWTAQSGGYKGEMFQRSMAPFHQFMPTPAPAAVKSTKSDRWTDQKSNGFFAAVPSIFYYDYTQDQTFLKNQLYPNMKAVDAFFRDYLTTSGSRLVMAHSSAHEASDDLNPNLDIGFIIRTENFLIQTSQKLGVDAAMIPVWQNTLAKLAKMPTGTVNGKTVYLMAENINGSTSTTDTFKPGDQPINMEGGVFPGENIYVGGDPTQLQIAINTLQQMNSWGVTSGENMGNGFPKEFPIAARAGWPAADLESKFDAAIKKQWRSTNLTVAQSGGGIETAGSIEAVDSMLMQSVSGTIRLFGDADWPTSKDASFTRLRAKGAFVVSAAIAGGKVSPVTLSSDVGGTVKIKNPWSSGTVSVTTSAGTAVPFTNSGGVISFATTAGTSYQVTSTTAAKLAAYRQPLGGLTGAPLFLGFGFAMAAAYLAGSRRRPRVD
jgi:glycosyl hydrolase family 95